MPSGRFVHFAVWFGSDAAKRVYAAEGMHLPRTLTPAKQRAQYRLNGEAERLQFEQQEMAPCRADPAAFVDYDDPRAPEVYEAQVECATCPFVDVCRQRARLERPAWGVWAGEVWGKPGEDGHGRIIRRQRRRQMTARREAEHSM